MAESRVTRARRAAPQPPRRGIAGFVHDHGWRAYALPILVVLTALAVFRAAQPTSSEEANAADQQLQPSAAAPTPVTQQAADEATPLVPNPAASQKFAEAKAFAELPPGGAFSERGAGTFAVVPGTSPQIGSGQLLTYTVEVEDGVQLPGGVQGFAQVVDATLNNPKSWIGTGKYAFRRIDSGTPRVRISLASQATARSICGFKIQFDASCYRDGRAVLNTARWERGAVAFQGNVIAYQQYVVNHEVGHALGFGHLSCPENGALAPVMMQQTFGVANDYLAALRTDNVVADGKVCAANPWPYPTGGG